MVYFYPGPKLLHSITTYLATIRNKFPAKTYVIRLRSEAPLNACTLHRQTELDTVLGPIGDLVAKVTIKGELVAMRDGTRPYHRRRTLYSVSAIVEASRSISS